MRILYSSNALWARTGYGIQGRYLLPRLQMLGHEVAQFAWYGLEGGILDFGLLGPDGQTRPVRLYPRHGDLYGNDILGTHAQHWQADLVITLIDMWVLAENLAETIAPAKWAPWLPIDHTPPAAPIVQRVKTADYPLVYCHWAVDELAAVGVPSTYMPLGFDPAIYKPAEPGERAAARQRLGIPEDAYLCTVVAANQSYPCRKGFPEEFQAFARFQRRHPEARLYLHTQKDGVLDLDRLTAACDIPPDSIHWVDRYPQVLGIADEQMAALYQASDVLLGASMAEGFGVPLIEAQACGTPVITTDFSSMPELTVNGIATPYLQKTWMGGDRVWGWQVVPDVNAIEDAMERIYSCLPAARQAAAEVGVEYMQARYSWDGCVRDYWAPWLARVERDLASPNGQAVEAVPVEA